MITIPIVKCVRNEQSIYYFTNKTSPKPEDPLTVTPSLNFKGPMRVLRGALCTICRKAVLNTPISLNAPDRQGNPSSKLGLLVCKIYSVFTSNKHAGGRIL